MSDGNIEVCNDCYFTHHYGCTSVTRPATDAEEANYLHGYVHYRPHDMRETDDGLEVTEWFSGESDTPADREPLNKCDGLDLFDNTCSDHDWSAEVCDHCGQQGEGGDDGKTEFTWSSCEGCGSTLGGSRYRLAYRVTTKETT